MMQVIKSFIIFMFMLSQSVCAAYIEVSDEQNQQGGEVHHTTLQNSKEDYFYQPFENKVVVRDFKVCPGSRVGARGTIASGVVVGGGVQIGDDVHIGHDALIAANARIGAGVRIGARVRIGVGVFIPRGQKIVEGVDVYAHTAAVLFQMPVPEERQLNWSTEVVGDALAQQTPWDTCALGASLSSSLSLSSLSSEEGDLIPERRCVVCLRRPVSHALLPCGHFSYCSKCVETLKRQELGCSVCRAPDWYSVKIYL